MTSSYSWILINIALRISLNKLLAESEVADLENSVVNEDISRLQIAVDDSIPMQLLNKSYNTESPKMSCLRMITASSSSNAVFSEMKLSRAPCRQYSITRTLHLVFSKV